MFKYVAYGVAAVSAVFLLICWGKIVESNDAHTFHVWQSLGGRLEVIDQPGMYLQNFGKYWEYPRTVQVEFKQQGDEDGDQSIRATFNDAGTAKMSCVLVLGMPTTAEQRLEFHRQFRGNIKNLEAVVYAHLTNAIKNSGPMMTATENQTGRKAEFNQIIEDQVRNGLYEFRRAERVIEGQTDATGKVVSEPIRLVATQIVTDGEGRPRFVNPSPLKQYGLTILQFSIVETEYDDMSRQQFAAKQSAFLKAESSRAERENEVQQALLAKAKGEREAAEAEATANLEKVKAEMQGKQKVAVAAQAKLEAETLAAQKLSVAEKEKEAALVAAQQAAEVARVAAENELKIAEVKLQVAEKDAKAKIVLAEAAAKEIEVGGKLKDSEKILAEIRKERDVSVAQALSQIRVPATVIGGQGADGKGLDLTSQMISYQLLKSSGLLNPQPENEPKSAASAAAK